MASTIETTDKLRFLTESQVRELADQNGTPLYVYSAEKLRQQANAALAFKAPHGITVRYAMKANSLPRILELFNEEGLHIDASSGYEAQLAIKAGIPAAHILLTGQILPPKEMFQELAGAGMRFNATSLHQLETFGELFPGAEVSVRINPGMGTGMNNRTTTGGVSASFGIWHEYIDKVHEIADRQKLKIVQVHTHVGSGTDPEAWKQTAALSVDMVRLFPEASKLSLGGGFKVGRIKGEPSADMEEIGEHVSELIEKFAAETGRKLQLEIEPGTFLVANAGAIIARIEDITDTGSNGYTFWRTSTGMTEILRPSLYGAQHPLIHVAAEPGSKPEYSEVVVVGRCCESGDILTPVSGDPEGIAPRRLPKGKIGDLVVIEGAGAYCASMAAKGYNSYPAAPEVLV